MIHVGNRRPRGLRRGTREIEVLTKDDRIIYAAPRITDAYAQRWIEENVITTGGTTMTATALWFDVEVTMPDTFVGSPETGWTYGAMHIRLEWTIDLATWASAGWITKPGSTPVALGGGRKKWFARYNPTPVFWENTLVDMALTCDRFGKSITNLSLFNTTISLPHYPYAMPSQAALLQTDLRAAGYTNATVSNTTKPLKAMAENYTSQGAQVIFLTMSGSSVVAANRNGFISLPNYPYALPSQKALLQTDLRNAGFPYTTVTLYADEWVITVPNRLATGVVREIRIQYTPADPFATWDFFGNYQGDNPGNAASGSFGNVRDPLGNPLTEAPKAFARAKLTFL